MTFRSAATLRALDEDEKADLYKLFSLRGCMTYDELGLKSQGTAIKLKGNGVLKKSGMKVVYKRKNTIRRTLWDKGPNYDRLLDLFIKVQL